MTAYRPPRWLFPAMLVLALPAPGTADVTYLGSDGVYQTVFSESATCTMCHSQSSGQEPFLDDFDSAKEYAGSISVRINLDPSEPGFMPRSGAPLSTDKIALVDAWALAAEESTAPQVAVGDPGHSAESADSVLLDGSVKQNGYDTMVRFRYWISSQPEPASCPPGNNVFSGCTPPDNPGGSGGGDIAYAVAATASGLNCATGYTFRALSLNNDRWAPQQSPLTGSFLTLPGIDMDGDGICDAVDNCPDPGHSNPDQFDFDGDGEGDACDSDDDDDSLPDEEDNCPLAPNPGQGDANHDGIGDACDPDYPHAFCFPLVAPKIGTALICL